MVWGGTGIARLKGYDGEGCGHIGESWELSGLPGHVSRVAGGVFDGRPLDELISLLGPRLVGAGCLARYGTAFPILVKLIDTAQDLSVQVHPDDRLAARVGKRGKNEMWYVVRADEDARLLCGWCREETAETFRRRISAGEVLPAVRSWPVAPGDVFYLPAGRIHALGRGMEVVEIQDASDVTYRIYDYGRPGLDGRPRELHVEQALEALDYAVRDDCRVAYGGRPGVWETVVEAPHFTTRHLALGQTVAVDYASLDSFVLLVCAGGRMAVADTLGNRVEAGLGGTVLLPATAGGVTLTPLAAGTCLLEVVPVV